ncbi:MAG TPA: DeoR/GlpR family DNA-binding transcription regulator [Puia sp.]|nr:DeoR/GlpR family DNA-binding transcription regulator [Puia sp.]
MNFQKRKQAILHQLATAGEADIKELASALRVSNITIRRDLNQLAADGLLRRTHGGAMKVAPPNPPYPFANKAAVNVKAKEAIARLAAAAIQDGDIVFLDCGSTVFHLCPFIRNKYIRVITNSLPIVHALEDSRVSLNLIGGEFDPERQAVHGKMAEYHIAKYRANKAFLGVDGISPKGLFANSEKEATLTMALIGQSAANWLLCDSSKIGRETYWQFASLRLIGTVITDAPVSMCTFLEKEGITVVMPS